MARLQDVIGGIMGQIARGRSQADVATVEIARIYKDHSSQLLSDFPIPRFSLDEVKIELRFAVAAEPAVRNRITRETKHLIVRGIATLVDNLADADPDLKALAEGQEPFSREWADRKGEILSRVSNVLVEGAEANAESLTTCLTALLLNHVTAILTSPASSIKPEKAAGLLQRSMSAIGERSSSRIREIVTPALAPQLTVQDGLEIAVTMSELQTVPPEKVSVVTLTMKEADRSWTAYQGDDGKTVEKLVPM